MALTSLASGSCGRCSTSARPRSGCKSNCGLARCYPESTATEATSRHANDDLAWRTATTSPKVFKSRIGPKCLSHLPSTPSPPGSVSVPSLYAERTSLTGNRSGELGRRQAEGVRPLSAMAPIGTLRTNTQGNERRQLSTMHTPESTDI